MNRKTLYLTVAFILITGAVFYTQTKQAKSPAPAAQFPQQNIPNQVNSDPIEPKFDKKARSIDDPASIWAVVNKMRPLAPKTYAPNDLVVVGGGQQMRSEAANALKQLITSAKTNNLVVSPLSGYRSYGTQVSVYNNEVNTNGQAVADRQSARPGHSEHQTGLAIDVGGGGCGIEDCFGNTAEGKWVAENAYKFGFVIRYVTGKESVTGYRAEPWHLRYIGVDLATEMQKQRILTLEEFFGLPAAANY